MTLYVSDLDGTLLDRDGKLSERSRHGLIKLLDQGLLFTVASARHVSSIRSILGDLPLTLPVISGNGAYIGAMHGSEHELVNAMEPVLAQSIFSLIRQMNFLPFFSTNTGKVDRLYYHQAENPGQQHFIDERIRNADVRFRHTTRLQDHLTEPVVTFVVIERELPLQALQAEIVALFGNTVQTHLADDLYCPGWFWLTIHDQRASKDQAIKIVAERYGLSTREIVVFGDHANDLGMMRAAHRGIATANAIPAVKQVAYTIIGAHYEDSVIEFIERDWRR